MMMLSNSLQWPNKIGAQRKAAHPSPMGRLGIPVALALAALQEKVRKFEEHGRVSVTNRIYCLVLCSCVLYDRIMNRIVVCYDMRGARAGGGARPCKARRRAGLQSSNSCRRRTGTRRG